MDFDYFFFKCFYNLIHLNTFLERQQLSNKVIEYFRFFEFNSNRSKFQN